MWHIYQFPLCPFSRKVRLLMAEKGIAYELQTTRPWEGEDRLFQMNPAGRTPVVRETDKNIVLADSRAICEYFEETVERNALISGTSQQRAEIRRLIAMFDENFFLDVSGPLLHEKMKKRLVLRQAPDARMLRDAMRLAHDYLDYIDYLIDNRPWLAGATMTLADLAAAAQISVADYLGGLDWSSHEQARGWYLVMKSRPSFRPLLSERMEVIQPPGHYAEVDV
ncbi:glutathione S-transferase family protein [Novosphingobium sp. 1949]|uniref:Glutathione S-transferase family protein n=1 Tax=Novosphingobium organovorum TaxID=2930092 RepID=A0ABT0BBE7_9SPHN|nr:glutathione S-transferase family protein [Novosphingobium organovorum]MCJ2182374.1 glutathione S-transferase family protein [Novosphingobium organovorum]